MTQEMTAKSEILRTIINDILAKKDGVSTVDELPDDTSLTEDLELESLDLAEMTVRLEDQYGVDVFEDDVVDEVGEVLEKLHS